MTEARRLIVGADGKAGQVAGRAFVSRFYLETTGLILTGLQKAGSPVISDRALDRGDWTEGSLGGRLAQRLAALREV